MNLVDVCGTRAISRIKDGARIKVREKKYYMVLCLPKYRGLEMEHDVYTSRGPGNIDYP